MSFRRASCSWLRITWRRRERCQSATRGPDGTATRVSLLASFPRRTCLSSPTDEPSTSFSIFFFQAEDGIRDLTVTGVQTCALPILNGIRKYAVAFTFAIAL